jgi:hypothetical protein
MAKTLVARPRSEKEFISITAQRLVLVGRRHTLRVEHIRNNTARVRQGRGAERAGEKAQDDQGMDVLSTSGAGAEGGEAEVGEEEDDLSSVEFCPSSSVSILPPCFDLPLSP